MKLRHLVLTAALLALSMAPVEAQVVKPWTPAGMDSVVTLASSAKLRFQRATGDSAGGLNYEAYELVGQAARRLLRQLGRTHAIQAPAIEATLDSLGLDTDVVIDPQQLGTVLVMVRNPYKRTADAIGYLLWFRGPDLRMQGASFPSNIRPRLRAWWTGRPTFPYSAGVIYEARTTPPRFGFKYFRMSPDGFFWNLIQYEGKGPELGIPGEALFADINHDGRPELLSYTAFVPDSFLTLPASAPPILNELVYTERPEGFVLHDARTVPGPTTTLRLFALLLMDKRNDGARQLLLDPAKLDQGLAQGWGATRAKGSWTVEYAEPEQAWPEWLAVKIKGDRETKRWIFHFTIRDGRWIIRDWVPIEEKPALTPATGGKR